MLMIVSPLQQFAISVRQKGFRQQRSLCNVPCGATESVVTREETSARIHQPFTTIRQERLRITRSAEVWCNISLGFVALLVPWDGQHMLCIRFGQDYYLLLLWFQQHVYVYAALHEIMSSVDSCVVLHHFGWLFISGSMWCWSVHQSRSKAGPTESRFRRLSKEITFQRRFEFQYYLNF